MPSDAAKAKQKVKREQQQLDNQQSQPGQPDAVDGKQVKAINPQMQKITFQLHCRHQALRFKLGLADRNARFDSRPRQARFGFVAPSVGLCIRRRSGRAPRVRRESDLASLPADSEKGAPRQGRHKEELPSLTGSKESVGQRSCRETSLGEPPASREQACLE